MRGSGRSSHLRSQRIRERFGTDATLKDRDESKGEEEEEEEEEKGEEE